MQHLVCRWIESGADEGFFAIWALYKETPTKDQEQLNYRLMTTSFPLDKFLTKFFCGSDIKWSGRFYVTEETARWLSLAFDNAHEHYFWWQALKVLDRKGKDKAWKWLQDKLPLLLLSNKLEGRNR